MSTAAAQRDVHRESLGGPAGAAAAGGGPADHARALPAAQAHREGLRARRARRARDRDPPHRVPLLGRLRVGECCGDRAVAAGGRRCGIGLRSGWRSSVAAARWPGCPLAVFQSLRTRVATRVRQGHRVLPVIAPRAMYHSVIPARVTHHNSVRNSAALGRARLFDRICGRGR